ncbi:Fatty acid synthase subunit alpha 6, partial [Colletotrichum chlorophyti]
TFPLSEKKALDRFFNSEARKPRKLFLAKIEPENRYRNWCSREVEILSELGRNPSPCLAGEIEQLTSSIINRFCERSIVQIHYLCSKTPGEKTSLGRLMRLCLQASRFSNNRDTAFIERSPDLAPITQPKVLRGTPNCTLSNSQAFSPSYAISVGTFDHGILALSERLSLAFAEDWDSARHSGCTFGGRNFLLTEAGKNFIGMSLLKNPLQGGRVTFTPSTYSPEITRMYQRVYSRYGAKGSVVWVVPLNQGSQKVVHELSKSNLDDWDPDFIIPFADISENGRRLEELDSRSEIAHRLMLTNLLRLLGAIARNKRTRGIVTRPATVPLPLPPNYGLMGSDGLYGESKRGLESILSKWKSET